jgi:hypothetical protein
MCHQETFNLRGTISWCWLVRSESGEWGFVSGWCRVDWSWWWRRRSGGGGSWCWSGVDNRCRSIDWSRSVNWSRSIDTDWCWGIDGLRSWSIDRLRSRSISWGWGRSSCSWGWGRRGSCGCGCWWLVCWNRYWDVGRDGCWHVGWNWCWLVCWGRCWSIRRLDIIGILGNSFKANISNIPIAISTVLHNLGATIRKSNGVFSVDISTLILSFCLGKV